MRKALIAAAVATALFAVGAFAASFAVSSEDIASGNDKVEACAPNVRVDFSDPTYVVASRAWTVDKATVTFLNGATPVDTCKTFAATLKVSTTGDVATGTATWTVPAGTTGTEVTFSPALNVKDINGSAVLVEGVHLTPAPAP